MTSYESGYDPKYGYNRHAFENPTIPMMALSKTIKLITTPIGLATEAYQHRKDKKRSPQQDSPVERTSSTFERTSSEGSADVYVNVTDQQAQELIASGQAVGADGQTPTHELVPEDQNDRDHAEQDEEDWSLDEAVAEIEGPEPPAYQELDPLNMPAAEQPANSIQPAFLLMPTASSKTKTTPSSILPFPVVIPQRRPGTKTRGFVRAYAPVLDDAGISQDTFLSFLKNLHTAAQSSKSLKVIQVAAGIAGVYPDIIVASALQAFQIAVGMVQEVQERWRANRFLDQANRDIFVPRGLYAMVVTYKPVSAGADDGPMVREVEVDLGAQAVAKYGDNVLKSNDESTPIRQKMQGLRIASAETKGEAQMPAMVAPLIFPALEAVAAKQSREERKGDVSTSAKSASKWVNDYFDRRALALYLANNPNSTLGNSVAAPEFKSKIADPRDARNTHLITLLTGGLIKAEPLGAKRRWEKAQRQAEKKRAQGLKVTPKKRMLQEDVLYLMIVNMPTQAQLEKARQEIAEANGRSKQA